MFLYGLYLNPCSFHQDIVLVYVYANKAMFTLVACQQWRRNDGVAPEMNEK